MSDLVYLAGPIDGFTIEEVSSWRRSVAAEFQYDPVRFLDPTRNKFWEGKLSGENVPEGVIYTPACITASDLNDIRRCDLVVAYLSTFSIGTILEVGFACALNKPVVLFSESKSIALHPMLSRMCVVVNSMEDLYIVVRQILG